MFFKIHIFTKITFFKIRTFPKFTFFSKFTLFQNSQYLKFPIHQNFPDFSVKILRSIYNIAISRKNSNFLILTISYLFRSRQGSFGFDFSKMRILQTFWSHCQMQSQRKNVSFSMCGSFWIIHEQTYVDRSWNGKFR